MKSNPLRTIVLALGVLLILGGGIFWSKRQPLLQTKASHDLYYCPMHPQIQSDKPGSCPICYMNLVKKEDGTRDEITFAAAKQDNDALADHASVHLTDNKQQLIGIKTMAVEKRPLTKTIRTFGYVAHDLELYEAQLEYIEAWRIYYAYVIRRPAKVGFTQDWRDYYLTTSTTGAWRSEDEAKAELRLIKAEYELTHMGIDKDQLLQLREIKFGQPWVRPDLLFFEEDQMVWVYAQIFESDLGFVTVGQKATITIPAYKESTEGVVRFVTQAIDPVTRTAQARIEWPAYRGELMANMFVDVEIHIELNDYIIIPREALMDTGINKIVFVQTQEGVFEPRKIKTSYEGDGTIAVTAGLEEGERIVVSGNFLLDSESRLKAAIEGVGDTASATNNSHVGH